jgi:spermidine synthase
LFICAAGLLSAAMQCVFIREYLAVFAGNEFIIGLVLSVWLIATGLGSLAGQKVFNLNIGRGGLALISCAVIGTFGVRASRLFFMPGEIIGPLPIFALLLLTEAPFAFINGCVFGSLSKSLRRPANPYGFESLGALCGSLMAFACVLLYGKNTVILVCAGVALLVMIGHAKKYALPALAVIALLVALDNRTMHWKYNFPFTRIIYGREGEIAVIKEAGDTTIMLNGTVYKSTMERPFLEQSVHIPMAQRKFPRSVLVVFDKGHNAELAEYPGLSVDRVESEPRIATPGSIIAAVETFNPSKRYDVILLGASIPQTAAAGRFFTVSFFRHMESLMPDSGVFSFTLPFSENYMGPAEKKLYDVLYSTLGAVFKSVTVFPGEVYTFMASDRPFPVSWRPRVKTQYLESMIIPAVSARQITDANKRSKAVVNTSNKPFILLSGLTMWTELFKGASLLVAVILGSLFIAVISILPKTRDILSIGSTGFAAGVYSVALLLLYQSTYGLLYSRISLLLIMLTCGFFAGTLFKHWRHLDLIIGLYCCVSLGALTIIPFPPATLFFFSHLGIGVLCGAQFVSRKNTPAGVLYAADLFGGALGMALCSTVFVPLFGVMAVGAGLCGLKMAVWAAVRFTPGYRPSALPPIS